LAGADNLPNADLLAAVLPRLIHQLLSALDLYSTELILRGITDATDRYTDQ